MTDEQFISSVQGKLIKFKDGNGLPVREHLIIADKYWIYNRKLEIPLIKSPFHSIIDAHQFCLKLKEIYGELLHILIDKDYAEIFFQITRYTIENGIYLRNKIRSLDNLQQIKRPDLAFILDE